MVITYFASVILSNSSVTSYLVLKLDPFFKNVGSIFGLCILIYIRNIFPLQQQPYNISFIITFHKDWIVICYWCCSIIFIAYDLLELCGPQRFTTSNHINKLDCFKNSSLLYYTILFYSMVDLFSPRVCINLSIPLWSRYSCSECSEW